MVYKKYIKKKGKIFGPYYYKSYKINGDVKKVYIGGEKEYQEWKAKNSKKISWIHRVKKGNALVRAGHSGKVEQLSNSTPSFGRSANNLKKNSIRIMNLFFMLSLIVLAVFFFMQIASEVIEMPKDLSWNIYPTASKNIAEFVSQISGKVSGFATFETFIEEENVLENYDKEVSLSIKSVPSIAGSSLTDNKNERMDFATSDGNIRLYFNLLNYSEFVSETNDFMVSEGLITPDSFVSSSSISEEVIDKETGYGNAASSGITGGMTGFFIRFFNNILGLTGKAIEPTDFEIILSI